jgi:hypothetical protein
MGNQYYSFTDGDIGYLGGFNLPVAAVPQKETCGVPDI